MLEESESALRDAQQAGDSSSFYSFLLSILGAAAIVSGLVYGALRVKKAGLSITSQTTVFSAPSFSAVAVQYETTGITEFLKKTINVILDHSHTNSFTRFWKRVPKRLWNFYINAFLIPSYRKEWGRYKIWSFRSPTRVHRPTKVEQNVRKLFQVAKKRSSSSSTRASQRMSSYRFPDYGRGEDEEEVVGPQPRPHNHAGCRRVRINVGGCIYETQIRTLGRYPHTLLGDPNRRLRFFNPVSQEYFFDRNQASFEAILYFYQSGGRLKRPEGVSADILLDDAKFYGLPQSVIYQYLVDEGLSIAAEAEDILPENMLVRKLWLLFDFPQSSLQAQIVSLISILAISLSITAFCIETIESLTGRYEYFISIEDNVAYGVNVGTHMNLQDPFFFTETVCSVWFIVEYLTRFASSPVKLKFLTDTLNIIDLIAVLPFCVQVIVPPDANLNPQNSNQDATKLHGDELSIIRIVRLVRVFRIFKLSRHSRGLKILGKTLQASMNELALLMFFVFIGVIMFASTMYFVEVGVEDSSFHSIPDSFWWALITLTTVGYGDDVPKTTGGKIIGAFCAVAGVLVLALPVPVIVSNFNFFYHQALGETDLSWIRIKHSTPCPFRPMDGFAGIEDPLESEVCQLKNPRQPRAASIDDNRRKNSFTKQLPPQQNSYSSDEEFEILKKGKF